MATARAHAQLQRGSCACVEQEKPNRGGAWLSLTRNCIGSGAETKPGSAWLASRVHGGVQSEASVICAVRSWIIGENTLPDFFYFNICIIIALY